MVDVGGVLPHQIICGRLTWSNLPSLGLPPSLVFFVAQKHEKIVIIGLSCDRILLRFQNVFRCMFLGCDLTLTYFPCLSNLVEFKLTVFIIFQFLQGAQILVVLFNRGIFFGICVSLGGLSLDKYAF